MPLFVQYAYFGIHIVSDDELVNIDFSVIDNDPSDSPFFWGTTLPVSVEYILNGNDHINISASTFNGNVVHAGAGEDSVFGGSGDDTLTGDLGDDLLAGNLGNDSLFGGVGDDSLSGGEGNDFLHGGVGSDSLNGDQGNDLLRGDVGDDNIFGEDGDDDLRGNAGSDELGGGAGNDVLRGQGDNDELFGDDGDDEVRGGHGDDYLEGYLGNDILNGGLGDDELFGGLGADTMSGGPGQNFFYYETLADSGKTATTRDVISGFRHNDVIGQDVIDLFDIDASSTAAGNQAFTFIGSAAFTGQGQIRVVASGGDVLIQLNTGGSLAADMVIEVSNDLVSNFSAADFIL